jgi:hypothetical protein
MNDGFVRAAGDIVTKKGDDVDECCATLQVLDYRVL